MKGRKITQEIIEKFKMYLREEEKSKSTVEKYLRDVRAFREYTKAKEITKEIVIEYKLKLSEDGYAVRSVNSMLASLNSLFAFLGWHDLKVKTIKIQREIFCSEEKENPARDFLFRGKSA